MVKYLDNKNNSGFGAWNANKSATQPKSKFTGFMWWVILFVASWWLLSSWLNPPQSTVGADIATEEIETIDISGVGQFDIASDKISATVQGLRIYDIDLNEFAKNGSDADASVPVSLLSGDNNFAEVGFISSNTTAPELTSQWTDADGAQVWRNADGIEFVRQVTVDGYLISVTDEIKNTSSKDVSFVPYVRMSRNVLDKPSAGVKTGAIAYVNSDLERMDWSDLDKKAYAYSTTNGFIGFSDQYWQSVASINRPDQTVRFKKTADIYQADVATGAVKVAPNATETITTTIFAGPRTPVALNIAADTITGITDTMDYGFFGILARPMLWVLNAINAVVMNYGIAIILLTLVLRLLMWPLTRKSYTSMMAMQKMQPEMAKIQKLYANDKTRLQMEMMKLYQTHKTSPMSGCLPMLIQIPIFFALYKALLISVQMRSAHFLWISDLSAMDPYFILPILMGATMWWQQRLQSAKTPAADAKDPAAQTQKMMKYMPLIFTVMFAWMPSGLVLYWTVSNLFGIAQMYIIRRASKK